MEVRVSADLDLRVISVTNRVRDLLTHAFLQGLTSAVVTENVSAVSAFVKLAGQEWTVEASRIIFTKTVMVPRPSAFVADMVRANLGAHAPATKVIPDLLAPNALWATSLMAPVMLV